MWHKFSSNFEPMIDNVRALFCLCVFLGVSVRFALRPCGNKYRIVGKAYVDGVMFREAIKESKWIVRRCRFCGYAE